METEQLSFPLPLLTQLGTSVPHGYLSSKAIAPLILPIVLDTTNRKPLLNITEWPALRDLMSARQHPLLANWTYFEMASEQFARNQVYLQL
ncbi:unnamed protein product [Aspergillus oryzae]|nr:unnamed protein product [Aspergillus oryzae]GMF96319.1 unnamed protein product [Aspergillus oryzae]